MCDYSSFSSIDKFPFPCVARSGVAMPAPRGWLPAPCPALTPAPAAPGTAREPPAAALRRYLVLAADHWGPL